MAPPSEKQRLLTRRAFFLGGLKFAGLSALAGRLYYLQFIQAEEYKTLAENNRIKLQLVAPPRGHILDCNGVPLALNDKNYQLFLEAASLPKHGLEPMLEKISRYITLGDKRTEQIMREHKARPFGPPLLIKEHLEWEELAKLELNQLELPACYIEIGQVRAYPFADHCAHLLGYVGAVAPEEMNDTQPLLKLPEFKIGKSGAEKLLEDRLRGAAGIKQIEVNVHGQHIREVGNKPSTPGENIELTIHAELQEFTSRALGDNSASVVVMDVKTGAVYTLASMPAYDPNIFSKGIPSDYWKELQGDNHKPLINKAIQGQYPPGSTFKMVTGLAGLQSGAITTDTHVFCPGHFFLGTHRFNCWKEGGHGTVNLHSALAGSCDTFFYTVAQRMGIEPLRDMARAFGFGSLQDLGLLGEKAGLVPDPDWKMKRYKDRWNPGDTVNAGIGQGYVLGTPLQLAVMTARIASGKMVKPTLLKEEALDHWPAFEAKEAHLKAIRDGMNAVTNESSGTAYSKRITQPEFAMAGKTGTAQVRRILVRGQNQDKLPWEFRHHAWFVAYAPVADPKYAIAVMVEHGGGGASAAAPVARDILLKAQELKIGK